MARTGIIGERIFKLWCSQADITCNQADEDNVGWDFKLDFPIAEQPDLKDIHKGVPHCLVQVKTTRTGSKRALRLKLSNMYRHATVLEPIFLVFIRLSAKNAPRECHVVHIDRFLMERTLKQVAEALDADEPEKLHKLDFLLPLKEGFAVPECSGPALRTALLSSIGGSINEYIEQKRLTLERLGFSERPSRVSFSINDEQELKAFLMACLGKEQQAEVQDIRFETERFGRVDESLSFTKGHATVSVQPEAPLSKGSVLISGEEYGPFCEFSAKLFILPFLSSIGMHMPAFRIKAGPIDIVINKAFSHADFEVTFEYRELKEFSEIERFGRLLQMLTNSNGNIHIQVRMGDKQSWSQIVHAPSTFVETNDWIRNDAELIANTTSLFQYFEIGSETAVSMEHLMAAQSSITTYANLLSGRRIAFKVIFDVEKGTSVPYSEAIYVSRLALRVANIAMALIVSIPGNVGLEENGDLVLYSHTLDIAQKAVGFLPDSKLDSKLSTMVNELASELEEEHNVIVDTKTMERTDA